MSKKNPIVLAVVSDLHAGSTVGLCKPVVNLGDGGTYRASTAQRWLWRCWRDADKVGAKIITVVNGDATEGNHHQTLQVITANETGQPYMADKMLKELVQEGKLVPAMVDYVNMWGYRKATMGYRLA